MTKNRPADELLAQSRVIRFWNERSAHSVISAQSGGEKSSPNIPHHRDQLPPSDDASLRMTPSFFDGKRDGCLESAQNRSSQQIIREETLKYLQIQSQYLQLVMQVESVIIATRKLKKMTVRFLGFSVSLQI